MSLWEQLREEFMESVPTLSNKKALAAISTLERVMGGGYVLPNYEAQTAEVVKVPGDGNPWVVFGRWDDGTLDIIREGGMFPSDVLTGWRPGQSVSDYRRELDEEFKDETDDAGAAGDGEAAKKGDRGPLSVVSGSGVRRGNGRSAGPNGSSGDHSRGKKDKADRRPGPAAASRRTAADALSAGRGRQRKS